jgi:hypothetical protein
MITCCWVVHIFNFLSLLFNFFTFSPLVH